MTASGRQPASDSHRGSALILTVVLTSLLAILGVLFLLTMRMDRMATTATSESRQLDLAIDTVVTEIGDVLAEDVPGVVGGTEYYDYPNANDSWLADLEPYASGGDFYWRQVSDLTGRRGDDARDVLISIVGQRDAIVEVGDDITDISADADGDGVSDALWFELPNVMSNKGKPIFAAVRIVDNSGMLNLNAGYWFAPDLGRPSFIDGHSPLHINTVALGGENLTRAQENALAQDWLTLHGIDPCNPDPGLNAYETEVMWRYLRPNPGSPYTPFDISDELDLRYRFILERRGLDTRAELWGQDRLTPNTAIHTPVDRDLNEWFPRVNLGVSNGVLDPNYAYRHIATTYNLDRVIMPGSADANDSLGVRKMVCVNDDSVDRIRDAVRTALIAADPNATIEIIEDRAAQIAANVRDYVDRDDEVTVLPSPADPNEWIYGFESPRVYISEVAYRGLTVAGIPYESYAIELYKPYFEDNDPIDTQWELFVNNPGDDDDVTIELDWSGSRRYHVVLNEDAQAEIFEDSQFSDPNEGAIDTTDYGYLASNYANPRAQTDTAFSIQEGASIELRRMVNGQPVTMDYMSVPHDWMDVDQGVLSIQRDISPHKCVRRLWASAATTVTGLGTGNSYVDVDRPQAIQAHPANRGLRNIGELGMVLARDGYSVTNAMTAQNVLIDLANPMYAGLLNYLTVIDPNKYTGNIAETRVMGRININTAPWFVLAQLPWLAYQGDDPAPTYARARAIVDYRNGRPFDSTAELMQVGELHDLQFDGLDNRYDDPNINDPRGPDLTHDWARDDLEERDLLFTRLSDLVTVRSDVFTAYILVRIGLNGPQKRVLAILDRSGVTGTNSRVRIVAIQSVPDPR